MGATTPQSTIKLYNAPEVISRAGDTLIFGSAADREAYFATKLVETNVNCTVVKKRYNTIKVKASMATLETCNYISFINPSYGNKLFYAFILSTDYLNNEVSLVTYNIDWWMTDMFQVQFRDDTQLAREHLTNREYNLFIPVGTGAGAKYPDVEKMYTQEPLSCDPETEEHTYNVAGDNIGYLATHGFQSTFTAFNAMTNDGKTWRDPAGGTWDNTESAPTGYVHVMCFTVPKWPASQGADEETWIFRRELQKILYRIQHSHTTGTTLSYYPFFIYDPDGKVYTNDTYPYSMGYYFIGKEKRTDSDTGTSYSSAPIEDTQYARPYMMVACESMSYIQEVIDYLNSTGNISSILGIYEMPIALLDDFFYSCNLVAPAASVKTAQGHVLIPLSSDPIDLNSTEIANMDKKLRYFPYSYYVLEGVNNNSRMEFKYELSKSTTVPGGTERCIKLLKGVTVNASGVFFTLRPYGYKNFIIESYDAYTGSLDNTMVYSEFPQVPYNTDAYASFIAAKAKDLMAENTREGLYYKGADYVAAQAAKLTSEMGVASNTMTAIGSAVTLNPVGAINGAAGAINSEAGAMGAGLKIQGMDVRANMMDAATDTLLNPLAGTEDNPIYDNFQMSRGAYIMPNYHPGSAGGVVNLMRFSQRVGIIVREVRRSKDFIVKYSSFFAHYGYNTKACKLPAVIKWLQNPSHDDAAHFEEGTTSLLLSAPFYTQTDNVKVSGVCGDSAVFIEHMFNGGVSIRKWAPLTQNNS